MLNINHSLSLHIIDKLTVEFYTEALSKLYILDLDVLKLLFKPCFSNTGKPSNQKPEIFRSFILMSELHYNSITQWVAFLKANAILCFAIGVSPNDVPGVGSHYDFIDRLWLENPEVKQNRQDSLHPYKSKPRKKLGKNQKQPPHHPGIIKKFVDLALQGKSFKNRPERLLQQIFAKSLWNLPHRLVSSVTPIILPYLETVRVLILAEAHLELKHVIAYQKVFIIVHVIESFLIQMHIAAGIVTMRFGIMDIVGTS